jgi:hypothetical protein
MYVVLKVEVRVMGGLLAMWMRGWRRPWGVPKRWERADLLPADQSWLLPDFFATDGEKNHILDGKTRVRKQQGR